jgi:hypothetical protein
MALSPKHVQAWRLMNVKLGITSEYAMPTRLHRDVPQIT